MEKRNIEFKMDKEFKSVENIPTASPITSEELNSTLEYPNDNLKYQFIEKRYNKLDLNLIRSNIEKIDIKNYLFLMAVSLSSSAFPIAMDMVKDKKKLKDIKQKEFNDLIFCMLPSIMDTFTKTTKGSMFEGIFGKLGGLSKYLSLSPLARYLIENINNNGGKINFNDIKLYAKAYPIINNMLIIPTINNPNVLKRMLVLMKLMFGKNITEMLDKKTGGMLKKFNIGTDDVFDTVINGVDVVHGELQKRNFIEKDTGDSLNDELINKGITLFSQFVLPKKNQNFGKNALGTASVGKRNSFI